MEKYYLTEIRAINPSTGVYSVWAGPEVLATSVEEAQAWCESNGLGYCKVLGEKIDY